MLLNIVISVCLFLRVCLEKKEQLDSQKLMILLFVSKLCRYIFQPKIFNRALEGPLFSLGPALIKHTSMDLDNCLIGPDYLLAWPSRASRTPWACFFQIFQGYHGLPGSKVGSVGETGEAVKGEKGDAGERGPPGQRVSFVNMAVL